MTHGTTLSEERTDRHCSVVFPMATRDATVARCHRPMIHDDREAGHRQARELKQPGGQASVPSVPVAAKPTAAPHRRPSVPSVSQPARPPGPLAAHRHPARPRPRGARWPPRRDSSGSDPDLVPRQRRRVSEAVRGDVIWLSGSPAVSSWADGRTRAVRSSVHASTPGAAGSLLVRKGPRPYLPSRTELLLPLTLCAGNRTRGGYMLHACAAATRAGKGGGDCAWPDRRGRRPSKGKDCFWPACPCGWASGVWCVIATVMASWQAANVLQ
uniref:Uncharacterized protein n=1 Tax=Setaria italica TaxID=4555 RepID=K3YUZ4_SETIT